MIRLRKHWYEVIPEDARPVSKKGVVPVEFAIEKDGQVKGSQIVTPKLAPPSVFRPFISLVGLPTENVQA